MHTKQFIESLENFDLWAYQSKYRLGVDVRRVSENFASIREQYDHDISSACAIRPTFAAFCENSNYGNSTETLTHCIGHMVTFNQRNKIFACTVDLDEVR